MRAENERQESEGKESRATKGRERQRLGKNDRSRVNAAGRGEGGLERERPSAVTPHSQKVPIRATMQTFSSFLLLSFLGRGREGEAENGKLIPKSTEKKFSSTAEASKSYSKGFP